MPEAEKRVWVTGAAVGIGAAIARLARSAGHQVIATDIDAGALQKLADELPGITTEVLDVSDPDAWEQVAAKVEVEGDPVDVLINNAGVCLPGRCDQVSLQSEQRTVEVNLMGVIYGVRALLPRFLQRQRGHVINIASMAAFAPSPDLASYCATKHAVRAYTHSCALDHRHAPIHWTVACPSAVQTPMLDSMKKKRAALVVFTEKAMSPETFAAEVVGAIANPRREVLVPKGKGRIIRLAGLFPGLVARGIDDALKKGAEALEKT